MAEKFDPYYQWLGIPPKDQPPNRYRLLGIEEFESNPSVIEAAAERQATYLHEVSTGPYVKASQKLLNEVAAAKICLLTPKKKTLYDKELQQQKAAKVLAAAGDDLPDYSSSTDDLFDIEALGDLEAASDTLKAGPTSNTAILGGQAKRKKKTLNVPVHWLAIGGGVAALLLIIIVVVAIIVAF